MTENTVRSNVDGYGFQRPGDFDHKKYEAFMAEYLRILTRRAMRWSNLIGNNDRISKSGTAKRFCRKGIPDSLRPMVWMNLSGAQSRMETNPRLYTQMLSEEHDETLHETILMDIHRTFPDNLYFGTDSGPKNLRKPLYNVLIAIAHRNKKLGYCQGMNFIAGLLLLTLKSEEKVFWLMDTLIVNILPDYYAPDMEAVKIEQEVLGEIVKWKAPEIAHHVEEIGLSWCLVGMKWFICLFADVMPVDTVLRIWDCLFNEGSKILMRAALAIILTNKEKILACKSFGDITEFFRDIVNSPSTLHCHTFLQTMFKDIGSLPMARIQKLRNECTGRV